ncbi:ABC transporter ATP-binding protein [Lihuaxuella thermophila]|uniref:ABC-2 type transport system ATP-binding protein n=1 Tax=Lihuaxuella thermophila TaxID=1173111 RepID=A0A1H8CDJ6_9BACL|nr:ABC transporter ATP-binding protein [Lihuaxuella thermophila]SEM92504.1 ABC-2 type transport system ATP-binding protein [Lihuaxuella thermophila]
MKRRGSKGSPVLEVLNLTKRIGGKALIDQVSFQVYPGEVFGLLGPNGAGKTTLIRMMVGLMGITEGEVLIHGASIRTRFEEAIQHVGAIVENPEFYGYMSGYKNLVHFSCMRPEVTTDRIDEVVSLVRLDPYIDDPVRTYSLGMRQRLGLAQAILHRPSILILDEPTNGLDPAGILELRHYLRDLAAKEGTAVVVSSHLLSEMELVCDRVAFLQQGRLIDIRRMDERVRSGQEQPVRVEVDQPEKIPRILKDWGGGRHWRFVSDGFEIILPREQIADLNMKLCAEGIRVYEIRRLAPTLEQMFLEMTGDDPNA